MPLYAIFLCSFSILIAGFIGIVRFKKISRVYHPFIYCIWIACLNELCGLILYECRLDSSLNNNIYMLCESMLIFLLFRNLGFLRKPSYIFHILILGFSIIWFIENFIIENIRSVNMLYNVVYSFIVVLLSLSCINRLMGSSTRTSKNATLLLCLAFILYFTLNVIIYSFWLYRMKLNFSFLLKVDEIAIYINLVANLMYALAVLWMPKKIPFLLPL